ncbi:MAG: hypothetical protein ACK4K9_08700 [Bacteroidia bacterium]
MNKQVYIFSPDWLKIQQYLVEHFYHKKQYFNCAPTTYKNHENKNLSVSLNLLKLRNAISETEKKQKSKTDLIIFCPVDDWFLPNTKKFFIEKLLPAKWTGIYLNLSDYYSNKLTLNVDPKPGEPDYFFSARNCIGVVLLDRFMAKEVQSRVYKKVVVFPDISLRNNVGSNKIIEQIKQLAKGRMIVGMILLENENLEPFLQTALHAETDKFFFVCAGKIEPELLNKKEKKLLSQLLQKGYNNNYFILNDFDDDDEVATYIKSFDILFLIDGNYMQPHPLLTKAAILKKPVIASNKDVIGKLVSTFKLGVSVGSQYADCIHALNMLRLQMPFEQNFDLEKLNLYAQLQSNSILEESLEQILLF